MDYAIHIKNLTHRFGEKTVLDNISFQVRPGEIFGLLGPSGAGKTTLINILTGQLRATEGSSLLFGKASENMTGQDYKQLGIMMDDLGLYERLSCHDNLKFYQMIDGGKGKAIHTILEEVGLGASGKTAVMNLSKGMKNRLAFARALLRKPALLFLDEPTSGLDPATVESIHRMILRERERGATIFLTTHNMYEAEKLCDNIALLDRGKIIEYGPPSEICRRYNHQRKIQIHLKDGRDIALEHNAECGAQIVSFLSRGELETIHSTEPNLETIFIELTGRKLEA